MSMNANTISTGKYLSERLVSAGVTHVFTVPGDFTLPLLDELCAEPKLKVIGCCNELNAGYAADGYCRSTGRIGCIVVTFMVGSLSALNAMAGAYSDNLPVLIVVGSPNSNDVATCHTVHHTIGPTELPQSSQCFRSVVGKTLRIQNICEAQERIDESLYVCGSRRKPTYLELPCDLILQQVGRPVPLSAEYFESKVWTDQTALQTACEELRGMMQTTENIVLVAGSQLRTAHAKQEFLALANALSCAVAIMPDAKGLFSEEHPQFIGCYWGDISSHHVQSSVDSADLILVAGGVLTDYSTVGWTTSFCMQKTVYLDMHHISTATRRYPRINLRHILAKLANMAPSRPESLTIFRRNYTINGETAAVIGSDEQDGSSPLSLRFLLKQLQSTVSSGGVSSLVVEVGDAWFMGQELKLSEGVDYHVQLQYGSCGWALGACLGVALGHECLAALASSTNTTKPPQRVVALIGDGSFQFSAQALSTLIRSDANVTIVLLNNGVYTIERQIHDGPYNQIPEWRYAQLVDIFRGDNTNAQGVKVVTNEELVSALEKSAHHKGLLLVECCLSPDDCTSNLRAWGAKVAAANVR